MKEYALFLKQNGEAELYCGGQFAYGASSGGMATNVASLWNSLEAAGERIVEIRETGIDAKTGEQSFVVKTLPKASPGHASSVDEEIDASCGYLGGGPVIR